MFLRFALGTLTRGTSPWDDRFMACHIYYPRMTCLLFFPLLFLFLSSLPASPKCSERLETKLIDSFVRRETSGTPVHAMSISYVVHSGPPYSISRSTKEEMRRDVLYALTTVLYNREIKRNGRIYGTCTRL